MKRDPATDKNEYTTAMVYIRCCLELYALQVLFGRYFLHEHPRQATSWREPEIKNIIQQEGVDQVIADQCQSGQRTDTGEPPKKPIRFMSNGPLLLKVLNRCCFGRCGLCPKPQGGKHAESLGKKAQRAAISQEELCMAILRGLKNQLLADRRLRTGEVSLVEAEGVLIDGTDEIDNFYAGLIGQEPPATTSLDASASDRCESDSFALRFWDAERQLHRCQHWAPF